MEHTHKNIDLELSHLRTKVSQMGDLIIAQIESASDASANMTFPAPECSSSRTAM